MRLWLKLAKFIAKRHLRATVWFSHRVLDIRREVRGDQLFDAEADLLGQLYEMPHWKVFLKYLDIERNAATNNGLVLAKDLMEVGEVKGDIGRINKIESDITLFWEEMQKRNQTKKHERQLAEDADDGQSADI